MYAAPVRQLKTDRNWFVALLLSVVTCGIYGLIFWGDLTDDVNTTCSHHDGKKTMNYYLLYFLIAPITFGIGAIVWMHKFCARIGDALESRGIDFNFGAGTFWGWGILGSLIFVGPFIFFYKLVNAINLINDDFNRRG